MWEKNLKIYDHLVSGIPEFERKGKTMPYTSANGYMFSLLNKDGEFGIRLSKESGAVFMKKYKTTIYRSYGAIMKDYVLIPQKMMKETRLLRSFLKVSYSYVMSLPPK